MNVVIQNKLRELPASPGVYLMKDAAGGVIYVGKSKNLKQRVRSYFHESRARSAKVERLVHNVKDLEIRLTDTEFEAFMLECRLIHELKPVYNKQMKSPLGYVYLAIRDKQGSWRMEVTGEPENEPNLACFGPFTAKRNTVEQAVQGIREYLKIACSKPASAGRAPCLNHSLGLCLGTCLGGEAVRINNERVGRFIAVLDGSDPSLYEELAESMREAAERYDFEGAARCRDALRSIDLLLHQEQIVGFTVQSRNIAILEPLSETEAKLFLVRRNRVLFSEKVGLSAYGNKAIRAVLVEQALSCFTRRRSPLQDKLTREEIDEAQIIYRYVQSSSCRHVLIPEEWITAADYARVEHELKVIFC
ncbi:GIY-YIG nuclease family protein [Paenibacillus macerans]|uniref:GIY-YIG nuclease family protein n=1 Tax=Paenibacillus macerans TaxID=44252 RepID=UPI003D31E8C9